MKNFIITVSSCQLDQKNGHNAAVRQTWGKVADELGVRYVLTIGGSPLETGSHEVGCDAPDDYINLGHKTKFNVAYALEQGCEWMFQCFTDTYISIPRLLKDAERLGPEALTGNFFFSGREEDHPCGGSGYWISKAAMELIHGTELTREEYGFRRHAEDRWVSWICRRDSLTWKHDPFYDNESARGGVSLRNQNVTNHLSFAGHRYNPAWMHDEQQQELTGKRSRRR